MNPMVFRGRPSERLCLSLLPFSRCPSQDRGHQGGAGTFRSEADVTPVFLETLLYTPTLPLAVALASIVSDL